MRLQRFVQLLVLFVLAACIFTLPAATFAAPQSTPQVSKSRLFRQISSSSTPLKDAAAIARKQPEAANELCLDILFYRWASSELGATFSIAKWNDITFGLGVNQSPAVAWAKARLLPAKNSNSPDSAAALKGETIDRLNDARKAVRDAKTLQGTSPVRAAAALTNACAVVDKLGLELSSAVLMSERGRQRLNMGQYGIAEDDFEHALIIFSNYGSEGNVAELNEALGELNMDLSRFNDAAGNLSNSANIWLSLRQENKACRQFTKAGLAMAASGNQDQALKTMLWGREKGTTWAISHNSYKMLVEDLLEIGDFLGRSDDRAGARDILANADKWAKKSGDLRLQSQVLEKLEPAWIAAGNKQKADECAQDRRNILNRAAAPGISAAKVLSSGTAPAIADRSKMISDISTAAWALAENRDFRQSAALYEQSAQLCQKAGRKADAAVALWNAAKSYDQSKDVSRGLDARRRAADIAEASGAQAIAVRILVDIASLHASSDSTSALKSLQEAASIALQSGNQRDYAMIQFSRGKLLAGGKEYAQAAVCLSDAAQRYLAYVGEPWTFAEVSIELAGVYSLLEKPEKEMSALVDAESAVHTWCEYEGVDASEDAKRADLLTNLYAQLIPLEVSAGKSDDAADHAKHAARHGVLPTVLELVEASGDAASYALMSKVQDAQEQPEPTQVSGGLVAQDWPSVLQLYWQLAQSQPRLSDSMPIGIAEIAKQRVRLPDKLAIVEYFISDGSIYSFVLARDYAYCRQVNVGKTKVQADMRTLKTILARDEDRVRAGIPVAPVKTWQDSHVREIMDVLDDLGAIFIAPIRGELKLAKTVAFAPPSELSGAPIHAFACKTDTEERFTLQDFAVSYVTPMMFPDLLSQPRIINNESKIAVFADPFENLPGAEEESEAIKQAFSQCDLFVGKTATKEQFRKYAASANVLHIAAHHKLEGEPGKFAIELAPGAASSGSVGVEDLCEVGNPKLSLVVLSACETASATIPVMTNTEQAADIISLLGASSVVGSYWKVSDKGSVELMGEFYRGLAKGTEKAESLRQAQLAMIASKKLAHPYYWAGFALFGNPY